MSKPALRVLVVEDQFLIAKQLESIIAHAGHSVVGIASSHEEGCAMVSAEYPDVAFVDISLADGVTGYDLAQYILKNSEAKVVFTTANRRRLPADFFGAIGVIDKPFTSAGVQTALSFIATLCSGKAMPGLKMPASFLPAPALAAQLQ